MADIVSSASLPATLAATLLRSTQQRENLINSTLFMGSPLLKILRDNGRLAQLKSPSIRVDLTQAPVTTWFENVAADGSITSSLAADYRNNLLFRTFSPAMLNISMAIDARDSKMLTGEAAIIDYLSEITAQHANAIRVGFAGLLLSGKTATAGTAPNISGLSTQLPVVAHVSSAKTVHPSDHGGLFEAESTLLVPKRLVGQTITSATIEGLIRTMALGLSVEGRVMPSVALSTVSAYLDLQAALTGRWAPTSIEDVNAGIMSTMYNGIKIIAEGGLDQVTIKSAIADADTLFFLSPEALTLYTGDGASSSSEPGAMFRDSGNVITSATSVNHAVQSRFFGQFVVSNPRLCGVLTTSSS